jgi:hypothetical protein
LVIDRVAKLQDIRLRAEERLRACLQSGVQ